MAANYVLLEKITVGAVGVSSVTFSGIPQTGYTDLVVKVSARSSTNNTYDDLQAKFNGVSLSYTNKNISGPGNGIAVGSGSNAYTTSAYCGSIPALTATSSVLGNGEICIPNYTSANYKSFFCDFADERNITTGVWSSLNANLWSNTAAITSIQFLAAAGDLVQYSTFYLYGVAKLGTTPVIAPYATGGDEIMLVGSYWYHIFSSSGTFRPAKNLSCDVLSVGGGGAGGISTGGGGGAGELDLYSIINTTANTNYTTTIGAGGAGSTAFYIRNNGNTTTFSTVTSLGGGGGGAEQTLVNGGDGGSGGGGGWNGSNGSASGSNTFAGGNGYSATGQSGGGGGGGATAVGTAGTNTNGGSGGQGYLLSTADSNFTSANFASFSGMTRISSGGGAGASSTRTAGTGGTGAGSGTNSTTAGSAATSFGSGGGGGGWVGGVGVGSGGNGAGGLVVVRYAV